MTAPRPRRTGRAGLVIGIAMVVVGIVAGTLLVIRGATGLGDTVEAYQRTVGGDGVVRVAEPGRQRVFLEYPGVDDDSVPRGQLTVLGPDGSEVTVDSPRSNENYSLGGRQGALVARFDAATAGDYRVSSNYERGELAIGTSGPASGLGYILGGVFGGLLVIAIGVVVIVIAVVLRLRLNPRNGPTGHRGPTAPHR